MTTKKVSIDVDEVEIHRNIAWASAQGCSVVDHKKASGARWLDTANAYGAAACIFLLALLVFT